MSEKRGKDERSLVEREEEELLALARRRRAENKIQGSLAHFYVARPIISIAENQWADGTSPALKSISNRIREVEREHGLTEDQFWRRVEGPPEYIELQREYERIFDEITAASFDEYGEPELGRMYRHDRARFDELFEDGRRQVFGQKATH